MLEKVAPAGHPMHSGVRIKAERLRNTVKITANMVTILRIVLMPIPGYLLYGDESNLLVALFWIAILGLTDWLDGVMARKEGPTVLGGLLDPIADKIFIAVIYLPLTDRGVIPIWLTACIFARDFVVTTLRTSLSLRNEPMRTATLAKYKTAIQMLGIGYVVLYLAHESHPDSPFVWGVITVPIVLPIFVILRRLFRKEKQGPRSITMLLLMIYSVGMRRYLGPQLSIDITIYVIGILTVISGFSYLIDAYSALRGSAGSLKELFRFVGEGVIVPVFFIVLLNYYNTAFMSAAIILVITIELAVGGLGNLLASQKIVQRFDLAVLRTLLQAGFAGTAIALGHQRHGPGSIGEICIFLGLVVTLIYAAGTFVRHRKVYLGLTP